MQPTTPHFAALKNPDRVCSLHDYTVLRAGICAVLAMDARLGSLVKESGDGYLTEGYFGTKRGVLKESLLPLTTGMPVDASLLAIEASIALANMCKAWHHLFAEASWPKKIMSVDWLLGYHLDDVVARAAHRERVNAVLGCPEVCLVDVPSEASVPSVMGA